MMTDTYRTIKEPSEGTFKEKGSRFLAYAFPVSSEEEIKQLLADLRKQYHDARHHCYAWRLNADMDHYRSNDDGEPAGSAGNPILGQIRSKELTNILIVVVRYFGGTLLGVGGLINAYRTAAEDALKNAKIIQKKVQSRWRLKFGYPQMNAVMKVIKEHDLQTENQQFDIECSLTVSLWKKMEGKVIKQFRRIENCQLEPMEQ